MGLFPSTQALSTCDLSPQARDETLVSCIGRLILNHWITREGPRFTYFNKLRIPSSHLKPLQSQLGPNSGLARSFKPSCVPWFSCTYILCWIMRANKKENRKSCVSFGKSEFLKKKKKNSQKLLEATLIWDLKMQIESWNLPILFQHNCRLKNFPSWPVLVF